MHRDIAARNCLISSRKSPFRKTKIGDFGLVSNLELKRKDLSQEIKAREVYTNDYYRGIHVINWCQFISPEYLTSTNDNDIRSKDSDLYLWLYVCEK